MSPARDKDGRGSKARAKDSAADKDAQGAKTRAKSSATDDAEGAKAPAAAPARATTRAAKSVAQERQALAIELPPAQQALLKLTGAKLCYGKPVKAGGITVIGVSSVRSAGGFGFGKAGDELDADASSGGGGGGAIDARPVGFIEIGPDGARFQPINDHRLPLAAIAGGAVATLLLARLLTRRRRRERLTAAASQPPLQRPRLAQRLLPR
jgi:uncharacterized spore protein YtfJ